jgi:hypothetical protein
MRMKWKNSPNIQLAHAYETYTKEREVGFDRLICACSISQCVAATGSRYPSSFDHSDVVAAVFWPGICLVSALELAHCAYSISCVCLHYVAYREFDKKMHLSEFTCTIARPAGRNERFHGSFNMFNNLRSTSWM